MLIYQRSDGVEATVCSKAEQDEYVLKLAYDDKADFEWVQGTMLKVDKTGSRGRVIQFYRDIPSVLLDLKNGQTVIIGGRSIGPTPAVIKIAEEPKPKVIEYYIGRNEWVCDGALGVKVVGDPLLTMPQVIELAKKKDPAIFVPGRVFTVSVNQWKDRDGSTIGHSRITYTEPVPTIEYFVTDNSGGTYSGCPKCTKGNVVVNTSKKATLEQVILAARTQWPGFLVAGHEYSVVINRGKDHEGSTLGSSWHKYTEPKKQVEYFVWVSGQLGKTFRADADLTGPQALAEAKIRFPGFIQPGVKGYVVGNGYNDKTDSKIGTNAYNFEEPEKTIERVVTAVKYHIGIDSTGACSVPFHALPQTGPNDRIDLLNAGITEWKKWARVPAKGEGFAVKNDSGAVIATGVYSEPGKALFTYTKSLPNFGMQAAFDVPAFANDDDLKRLGEKAYKTKNERDPVAAPLPTPNYPYYITRPDGSQFEYRTGDNPGKA